MRFHVPNVLSYEILSGGQRTTFIKTYLPPYTLDHLWDLEEALNILPGNYYIAIEGLDADIRRLKNPWIQQVTDFLASFCLVNLLINFI